MAGTPATIALTAAGIAFTVHEYEHDPKERNYGAEAARALGLATECVFKTLMTLVDGELCVAVVPVSGSLDLKGLAKALGARQADMAPVDLAQRTTGYVVGGISPIGQRKELTTVIDETVILHETIYVSGGKRGLDLGLAPDDLIAITKAKVAPIARD
jgi:Cys-tRNA(Pro)/Cys-tRNA(Cys) deacylase